MEISFGLPEVGGRLTESEFRARGIPTAVFPNEIRHFLMKPEVAFLPSNALPHGG
jgi:hypothetical protein